MSFSFGKFTDAWKIAYIQPIHKSGSQKSVENYRPISILSSLPKILDNIVTDKLGNSLFQYITQEQHGFVKGRSTLTNLIFNKYILINLSRRDFR